MNFLRIFDGRKTRGREEEGGMRGRPNNREPFPASGHMESDHFGGNFILPQEFLVTLITSVLFFFFFLTILNHFSFVALCYLSV
jgi:hypothetical protein